MKSSFSSGIPSSRAGEIACTPAKTRRLSTSPKLLPPGRIDTRRLSMSMPTPP